MPIRSKAWAEKTLWRFVRQLCYQTVVFSFLLLILFLVIGQLLFFFCVISYTKSPSMEESSCDSYLSYNSNTFMVQYFSFELCTPTVSQKSKKTMEMSIIFSQPRSCNFFVNKFISLLKILFFFSVLFSSCSFQVSFWQPEAYSE